MRPPLSSWPGGRRRSPRSSASRRWRPPAGRPAGSPRRRRAQRPVCGTRTAYPPPSAPASSATWSGDGCRPLANSPSSGQDSCGARCTIGPTLSGSPPAECPRTRRSSRPPRPAAGCRRPGRTAARRSSTRSPDLAIGIRHGPRNAAAPPTSPTSRSSGTPPRARAAAAASSGLAPGASRVYRFGQIAVYPCAANVRVISLVWVS